MKKRCLLLVYVLLSGILIFTVAKLGMSWYKKQTVSFSDPLMKHVICASMGKDHNADNITHGDLYTITELKLGFVTSFTTLTDLQYLRNLEKLYININLIKGDPTGLQYTDADPKPSNEQILSELKMILPKLKKLKKLGIANFGKNLYITDFNFLSNCRSLEELRVSSTALTKLSGLKGLKKLKLLELEENNIKDISDIKYLTNLTEIRLDNNALKDISALKHLKKLTNLYLDHNEIQDISSLHRLKNLKTIHLDYNQITDISASSIASNLLPSDL